MGYVSSRDHFRRYPQLITTLLNIHHHVKDLKYDFPFIICGDNGNGKSMLLLHIVDLWYNLILNQKLTPKHIKHVQNTRQNWIINFKEIKALDINANDEGADGLMSKESMAKFGRDIQKLYMVFRKKLFITPILIPDFFDLPPYFRKRVRGLIWVNKRGCFKYYTMNGIKYLNAYNENRKIKSMHVAYPNFIGTFPDYQGILREPYDKMAEESPDTILDDMVKEMGINQSTDNIYYSKVKELFLEGKNYKDIADQLRLSYREISTIRKKLFLNNEI